MADYVMMIDPQTGKQWSVNKQYMDTWKARGWKMADQPKEKRSDPIRGKRVTPVDTPKAGSRLSYSQISEIERKARAGQPLANPTDAAQLYYDEYLEKLQQEIQRKANAGIPLADPYDEERFAQWFGQISGGSGGSGGAPTTFIAIGLALVAILAVK